MKYTEAGRNAKTITVAYITFSCTDMYRVTCRERKTCFAVILV